MHLADVDLLCEAREELPFQTGTICRLALSPPDSNRERFCDLHAHSTASDGTDEPQDLARLAKQAGLSAFALTDHDTTAGLAAAAAAAEAVGIGFVPGLELSVDPDVLQTGTSLGTLHLLGYYVDPYAAGLAALSAELAESRAERNPAMVERLNRLGVRLTYDDVLAAAGVDPDQPQANAVVVGRPHIAQVLLDRGYVKSIHEAFHKYLGRGGAAFVRKDHIDAERAIAAVHAAGGVAVLAHPVQLRLEPDDCELAIATLKDAGLNGLEVRHPDHEPADVQRFGRYAEKFGLLSTGGSDYHGSRKAIALGSQRVPYAVYEGLKSAAVRSR